jgi:hypothetical protein
VASIYHSIQSDDVFVELELPTAAEQDGQQQQQPAPGAATAAAAWAGWGFGAGDAADSLQGQPAGVLGLPGGGDDDDDAQEAARPAGRRAGQPRVELAQERFTSW